MMPTKESLKRISQEKFRRSSGLGDRQFFGSHKLHNSDFGLFFSQVYDDQRASTYRD